MVEMEHEPSKLQLKMVKLHAAKKQKKMANHKIKVQSPVDVSDLDEMVSVSRIPAGCRLSPRHLLQCVLDAESDEDIVIDCDKLANKAG